RSKNNPISAERLCQHVHEQLGNVTGIRRWAILATEPRCEPKVGLVPVQDRFTDTVIGNRLEPVRYERRIRGSFPGVAYAVADELYKQQYSIRRMVLTELSGGNQPLRAGVYCVKPAY